MADLHVTKDWLIEMDNLIASPKTPDIYRRIREHLEFTAAEYAEAMEVSKETILRRERGTTAITREAWAALGSIVQNVWKELMEKAVEPMEKGKP